MGPKPDEIIPVVEDDTAIAAIEAATKDKEATEGGIKYDVVLSPAVKKQAPRITPPISPLTEDELNKKLNEATERRISLDNLRMKSLSEHMGKIELAQRELEHQLEAARIAAEASLSGKMESHK